jgi:hypothetical protein
MKKRILVAAVLVMALVGAMGASAADTNIFASYNKPGNVNLDLVAGWGGWLGVGAQAELIIGKFDLGPVPFQWGVMAAGLVDIPYIDIGAGAMATVHMGLSVVPLDFFLGLGIGANFSYGFPIGIAQTAGVAYKLSNSLTVMAIDTYLNGVSCYGAGIQLKL